MKFNNYFTEDNKYIKPTLIKFDNPIKIKLCELNKFLDSYKPFPCADVYLYEKFEYGDYDNWIDAIIESKTIDACHSCVYRKEKGVFKAGQTSWGVVIKFWSYFGIKDKFWKRPLQTGYDCSIINTKYIDEIEISVDGVYIISQYHKDNFDSIKEELC